MMRRLLCAVAVLACLFTTTRRVTAEDAITDPEKGGVEFQLQGEYEGEIDAGEGKRRFGAQIIALGDGRFRAIGYHGGLPGDGWKRGDVTNMHEGKASGGQLVIEDDNVRAIVEKGTVTVTANGNVIGNMKKTERKSPTLGKEPPAGAVVLFNGKSADAFQNGKLVEQTKPGEQKWLAASNCASKQKFGDHSLHVEFRTPFMPKATGQGRGNSGVYVQGRYEVQVLDSFGLEGENNECGGIYQIAKPAVNMCYPPLAWQTYDIDFTSAQYDAAGKKTKNARITVRHNGVVIHDNVELKDGTPGFEKEGPGPGPLFLQDHNNPVVFRNIWVVEKK